VRFYSATGTGVNEVTSHRELTAWPQPARVGQAVHVRSSGIDLSGGLLRLVWRDALGREAGQEFVAAQEHLTVLAPKEAGLWFLTLESTTGAHLSVAPVALQVVVVD
jgi:hypothetical protein